LVKWIELGDEEATGNELKDKKIRRRKNFLVRCMELV